MASCWQNYFPRIMAASWYYFAHDRDNFDSNYYIVDITVYKVHGS